LAYAQAVDLTKDDILVKIIKERIYEAVSKMGRQQVSNN
jgi:hypothetical protein